MSKPVSDPGQRLLDFVTRRFEETGRPVGHADMATDGPVSGKSLVTVRAALMARGLLRVISPGVARWLPGSAPYVPTEEEVY